MRATILSLMLLTSLFRGFAETQKIEKLEGYAERFRGGRDQNRVLNFFLGDHSRSRSRIRDLDCEISPNYRQATP